MAASATTTSAAKLAGTQFAVTRAQIASRATSESIRARCKTSTCRSRAAIEATWFSHAAQVMGLRNSPFRTASALPGTALHFPLAAMTTSLPGSISMAPGRLTHLESRPSTRRERRSPTSVGWATPSRARSCSKENRRPSRWTAGEATGPSRSSIGPACPSSEHPRRARGTRSIESPTR